MDYWPKKKRAGRANLKKKVKTNELVRAKNRGAGRANLWKKIKNGLLGHKTRERGGPT